MTSLLADAIGVTSGTGAVAKVLTLDLSQGPINDLCNQTTALALKLVIFFGLLALIVEAFGHGPEHRREYGGIAWRAFVVVLLLKFYAPVFGSVIVTTDWMADQFKPMEANEELSTQTAQYFVTAQQLPLPATSAPNSPPGPEPSWIGTKIYESSIHLIITLGQAAFWALGIIAKIALLLFYVIGPLALVASIPRASRVGTRWFGQYVGVACWPIFSALIVRIVLAVGLSGLYAASALGHVCVAMALGFCALAVPLVSNGLVGGSVTTAAQHGFVIAQKHASNLASSAAGVAKKMSPRSDKQDQEPPDEDSGSSPRIRTARKPPHNPPFQPENT